MMYKQAEGSAKASGADIARFFAVDINSLETAKSVEDFCSLKPEWVDSLDTTYLKLSIESLVRAGVLIEMQSGANFLERRYANVNFSEALAKYGRYEYLIGGFSSIADRLGGSVLPIVVEKSSGDEDLGSSFLVGNHNTILTARHVVENMRKVKVLGPGGSDVEIFGIYVSNDPGVDVALLHVRLMDKGDTTPLQVEDCELLEEVLSIGFPPIPGFEAVRVYDKAEINSFLRLSKGRVVSKARSYLDRQDFVLFNARVKGGNSGGPILNKHGNVCGMLVQIPISSEDYSKIDILGYGVAVPAATVLDALNFIEDGAVLNLRLLNDFEYSTLEV